MKYGIFLNRTASRETSRLGPTLYSFLARGPALIFGAFLLSTLMDSDAVHAQIEHLQEGSLIETELSGGVNHVYGLLLKEGDFIDAVVHQKGVDVLLALISPDGQTVAETDSPNGSYGPEELMAATRFTGPHRLEIRTLAPEQRGRYELKIEAKREPTGDDLAHLSAYVLTAEARELRRQSTNPALRASTEKYREVLKICEGTKNIACLADTLNELGIAQSALGERQEAIASHSQALSLWKKTGDRRGQATTLTSLGATYEAIGDPSQALEFYNKAHPLVHEIGDIRGEAVLLNNMGWVYHVLGNPELAIETLERALSLRRQTANRRGEASTLLNLAIVHENTGEVQQAILSNSKALAISTELGDRLLEAIALNNLGAAYWGLRDTQVALDFYERALQLARDMQDREREGTVLGNLGVIYGSRNEIEKALTTYVKALQLSRDINDKKGEATVLHNMGKVYEQAGRIEQARSAYQSARGIWIKIGYPMGEASTLYRIGNLSEKSGDLQGAYETYLDALSRQQVAGDKSNEAQTRLSISKIHQRRGDLSSAVIQVQEALRIIEEIRTNAGPERLRASFLASRRDYYTLFIDLLMELDQRESRTGYITTAFEVSERAKGRSLLDTLADTGGKVRRGANWQLLEREESLQTKINRAAREQARAQGKISSDNTEVLRKELDGLLRDLEIVRAEISSQSPKYSDLMQPEPLRAADIQALLGPGTLLLSYFLGEERSFLWAVTSSSLTARELPARAKIEAAARELHDLLSQSDRRLARGAAAQAASRLAGMILGPVEKLLGKNRLLIVADGALHYVPFAALPSPGRPGDPLVIEHEIVNLPSASVLAVLRKEMADRAPAPRQVAILADPVFRLNDPRVNPQAVVPQAEPPVEGEVVRRAAKDVGLDEFPRLRYTRQEAEAIASLLPPEQVLKALDFEASKETATRPDLSSYRILHFATHGLLDTRRPELSGLVLSLVDRQGRPRDGFLRLHEIYNLDLPADLVVLSGCETALGKEVRGEGLMALTRGFMYAGAPAVVASLWQIDDRSTGELMKRFYRGMIKERLSAPAALRKAQISLWKEKPTETPYFWAGFVFQGDWQANLAER